MPSEPKRNMAPYKIQKRGDKFVVVNNANEVKGTHATHDGALKQLRALYANVPGAPKVADRKEWTGKQKRALKASETAEEFFFEHHWVPVPGHPSEVATCDICGLNRWSDEHQAAAAKEPYGDVAYADPGYQKDGKKRYPIDSADHCRAAWSYINQPGNAAKYTPAQRERIKSRIAAAAKNQPHCRLLGTPFDPVPCSGQ